MRLSIAGICVSLLGACTTAYIPPGSRADLQLFTPPDMQAAFALKPAAPFPATVAAVRVQAPSYSNYALHKGGGGVFGDGRYTVVTVRDVEDDAQYDRIAHLPQLAGLATMN